jgi:hypothetical protein
LIYEEAETLLEVYSFEDILELNELTVEDVLCFLVKEEFLELPEMRPL